MDQRQVDVVYTPLLERGIELVPFTVEVEGRVVRAIYAAPPRDQRSADPVLLVVLGNPSSHFLPPNQQPAEYFWSQGHPVVSFDVAAASDLDKLCDTVLVRPDPFEAAVADAQAVLGYCVTQGWGRPGRIVEVGISRYAYFGFRLLAADERIHAGGGFAPVTDWRDLSEFESARNREEIADLRLGRYADELAGKHVYMCIGSHDNRVGTVSCSRFFIELDAANRARGLDDTLVDFHITDDPTHTCCQSSINRGMKMLLSRAERFLDDDALVCAA